MKSFVPALVALAASACSVDQTGDDLKVGGDGKADRAGLGGAYFKLVFDGGTAIEAGVLALVETTPGKLLMELGSYDPTTDPQREGMVTDADFALDRGFAERTFGPDCTLYIAYEAAEFDIQQAGACASHLPAGVLFDGRYRRAYATATSMTYAGGAAAASNAMTLIWMRTGLEFYLGVKDGGTHHKAGGFIADATPSSPAVYRQGDCTLTFAFTGAGTNTDTVELTQQGRCGTGGDFGMQWTLSE